MAGTNSNYSVLIDAKLKLEEAQKQLDTFRKENKINLDVGITGANGVKDIDNSMQGLTLTYQQFRQVLDSVIDVASQMYEQVKNLDAAVTEYSKVTDLAGDSLNRYVDGLAELGKEVARTGKPNRSEPVCCDGKAA